MRTEDFEALLNHNGEDNVANIYVGEEGMSMICMRTVSWIKALPAMDAAIRCSCLPEEETEHSWMKCGSLPNTSFNTKDRGA